MSRETARELGDATREVHEKIGGAADASSIDPNPSSIDEKLAAAKRAKAAEDAHRKDLDTPNR